MPRKQQIYTAKIKRNSDGAADAKIKRIKRSDEEATSSTSKKKPAVKKVEPAKKPAARRTAPKAETEAEKPACARTRKQPLTRSEQRAKAKAQLAAYERRQVLSRGGGFYAFLITMITVAFDGLGLLLCAVREGAADTQALQLLLLMAPMALVSTLVLPRIMRIDALLMALTNFLCGVSVVILYTVAPDYGVKQAVFYAAGMGLMLVMNATVSRLKKWRGLTGLAMTRSCHREEVQPTWRSREVPFRNLLP